MTEFELRLLFWRQRFPGWSEKHYTYLAGREDKTFAEAMFILNWRLGEFWHEIKEAFRWRKS